MAKWLIAENVLKYQDNSGKTVLYSAADIYRAMISCQYVPAFERELLLTQYPDLRYSKISAVASGYFWYADNQIHFTLRVKRRGKQFPVVLSDDFTDHYILDNSWFYISNISDELHNVLAQWGPDSTDTVSIGQYLHLLKFFSESPGMDYVDDASPFLTNQQFSQSAVPSGITAKLYPYQEQGFRWLYYMFTEGCGCILGDEMGLGKTLQIISLMSELKSQGDHHFLVVAPVTLLENWRREITKFAPDLTTVVHHGANRTGRYRDLLDADVIILSYGSVVSDLMMLQMIHWDIVVLDEAQNIKNPAAARTKAVKQITRKIGIAVTGTPFENHITDLWSLLDYIAPGFMGTEKEFVSKYEDNNNGASKIEPVLSPLMIRRRVSEVAQDLPDRVDIPELLRMDEKEAMLYEQTRQAILSELGDKRATLPVLQKLRMFCTHPFLLPGYSQQGDPAAVSIKYSRLCEILEEITVKRKKTILFTSYTGMFQILEKDIPLRFKIPVFCINGNTPVSDRQNIVDDFSSTDCPALLVLNPRAAGTGLNITAANYVIHYNLEWNPALEDQASARAYRRGQKETVFVYRLIYTDTVEQIVNDKIEAKRNMSDLAVIGTRGMQENQDDIVAALMLSPKEDLL